MKKTIRDNYRLEVYPDLDMLPIIDATRDALARQTLRDIKASIVRHVDDVLRIHLKWDTYAVCGHCGCDWTELTAAQAADPRNQLDEHSTEGEPVCCDKAVCEFRVANGFELVTDDQGGEGT